MWVVHNGERSLCSVMIGLSIVKQNIGGKGRHQNSSNEPAKSKMCSYSIENEVFCGQRETVAERSQMMESRLGGEDCSSWMRYFLGFDRSC